MQFGKIWQTLSVSKKLYIVVGVMALLIAMELLTLLFAMNILSAVRGFVGGEGLWSKGQKDAVLSLHSYVRTHDPVYYQQYRQYLEIPLGDRQARLALEQSQPDRHAAFEGFLRGGNHPDDIPKLIDLILRFHQFDHLGRALEEWRHGDLLLSEMMAAGEKLHQQISQQAPASQIQQTLEGINELNARLTVVEGRFSYLLGEGSRWLERLLMMVLVFAVLVVESTGLLLTISFGRNLSRGLKELNTAAVRVGTGDFAVRVPVRSGDELGQLADGINRMAENLENTVGERHQAESANQIKSQFLAHMSHEIRTPLGAIVGFADLLSDPNLTESERSQYLEIVRRTGSNLSKIINDILDLSKVEAGRLEIEKQDFSLTELLSDLKIMMDLKASEKGLELRIEPIGRVPERIHSDSLRLRQILVNLVGNAIKFTERGQVHLSYQLDGAHLVFTVRDTGPGLTEAQKAKLFQSFSQAQGLPALNQGTGLGLVISRRLAQMLGGDAELVESGPGQGSVFCARIEYQAAEVFHATPARDERAESADLTGVRVLVVEDNQDNRLLLERMLSKKGAIVTLVGNGAEGVRQALTGRFDLVLMDIQMPGMDGYAAVRALREKNFAKPVVALTAHAMKEDRLKALEAGFIDHVPKPIEMATLVNVLCRYLT